MLRAVVKGGLSRRQVHFVIDEAAALGKMDSIGDALAQYRGYGVRLQLYYQSLGQLKKCWPEGQDLTVLSNCTQVYFGINDNETADYVSNRLGEYTQAVASGGRGGGTSWQRGEHGHGSYTYSDNWSENWQQSERKLFKPEELMALSDRTAITFLQGVPPICTSLVRYYEKPPQTAKHSPVKCLWEVVVYFLAAALLAAGITAKAAGWEGFGGSHSTGFQPPRQFQFVP